MVLTDRIGRPLSLAVLISGSGRSLVNLAQEIRDGQLPARIVSVISSRDNVAGLDRARELGLDPIVIARRTYSDVHAFGEDIFAAIRRSQADLVCLAGFLSLLPIPEDYDGRVLNIHPALLPSFGGAGMYGHHVHEAVIAAGCKVSGCTVHFCDRSYDTGPILVQRVCKVREGDTPDSLAARVFAEECRAYPDAIRLIAAGRVRIEGRRTVIAPA